MLSKQGIGITAAVGIVLFSGAAASGHESCRAAKLEHASWRSAAEWNEATGADGRHYPPDRVVDTHHLKLELRFEDLETRRFTAVETLRVAAIGNDV